MTDQSTVFDKWQRSLIDRSAKVYDSLAQRQELFEDKRLNWGIPFHSPELVRVPEHHSGSLADLPAEIQNRWVAMQRFHPLRAAVIRASFVAYEGDLGMGKTLGAIEHYKLLHSIDPRYVLYTNVPILTDRINHKPIDFQRILYIGLFGKPFDDSHVLVNLDEIQNFVDSRLSLSHINRIFSNFASQIRKRKCKLVYTGSSAMLGDIRLRDLTKYVIKASKRELYDPKRECDDPECKAPHFFVYKVKRPLPDNKEKYVGEFILGPNEASLTLSQFDSFDVPPPAETMSSEMLERILGKISKIGIRENDAPLGEENDLESLRSTD